MNKIEEYIVQYVSQYPKDIVKIAAEHFNISVQAVNKHIKKLIDANLIEATGKTRSRSYRIKTKQFLLHYKIEKGLSESGVWIQDIEKYMPTKPNVHNIWNYVFSEMFNNAIEHSCGTRINVYILKENKKTHMLIQDDGIGIFKNIQNKFNLLNEHEAILELSKGKLTTDKQHHSGEGVFFSSRAVDMFFIESHGIVFEHNTDKDVLHDKTELEPTKGTTVAMVLSDDSNRVLKDVFDEFAGDNYGFDKTVIPIELARYGDDNLVSRSQARRVLNRVNLFKYVIFDFDNVPQIGQAFADEIFRVFANANPGVKLDYINANDNVIAMINRAKVSNINEL